MKAHPLSSLGDVLARMLGEAFIQAHGATVQASQHARIEATSGWMEHLENELAPVLDKVVGAYLERDDLPEGLRALFGEMGTPTHQFDVLLQLIGALGAVATGIFTLGAPELQQLLNQLWSDYTHKPLDPALAADAVERNVLGMEEGWAQAKQSGYDRTIFGLMVGLAGEPPGLEQMLSLWRRGLLPEHVLDRMIAYSRVRTEWTDYVKALSHSTMTPGDALEAVLKGVIDHAQGVDLFQRGGGLVEQFDTLLATTGNPIGVEAANTLFNHGFIDDAQLTEVIRHSRVNPIFEPMAKLLRHHFLPAFQVVRMLTAGTATPEQGTEWLLADGYPQDQVVALVHAASGGKTAKHKDLTEAQVAELYEVGKASKASAEASLALLGYDQSEADMILSLYESKRELAMAHAGVSQVRKVFLAKRVDDTEATTLLASLGIDAEAITQYLRVWEAERGAELKELSAAQIGTMAKKGLLTFDEAIARWTTMGYSPDDAALLAANYGGTPPPSSPAAQTTGVTSGTPSGA